MNQTAKQIEEVILEYERRWGYDAFDFIKAFVQDEGVVAYNA